MKTRERAKTDFFLVGTPIGNLEDISIRALRVLKEVDLIYCEDTRRSLKLLNHFEIKKPLRSCPYFKEKQELQYILNRLEEGQKVAYVSDAGMPCLSDPGALLLGGVRDAGFNVEVIGGVSSLTQFVAGLGRELEDFCYVGFLPEKTGKRRSFLETTSEKNLLFFESPFRLQKTLEMMNEISPTRKLSLAKELTKISERYFEGTPAHLLTSIPSWKGEWVGLWWKDQIL